MGNMLESDSSGSDIETTEAPEITRTDGDGMEFVKDSLVESPKSHLTSGLVIATGVISETGIPSGIDTTSPPKTSDTHCANTKFEDLRRPAGTTTSLHNDNGKDIFSRASSTASLMNNKDQIQPEPSPHVTTDLRKVASSPRQLPARSLLIPVKTVKCEPKTAKKSVDAEGNIIDKGCQGINKQKNAKFVPYEPYTCAVRPMVPTPAASKHKRKPSDSSSVVSQSSVHSSGSVTPTMNRKADDVFDGTEVSPSKCDRTSVPSPNSNMKPIPERTSSLSSSGKERINHHNNHSAVLLRERLKIAEKEISDLQGENAKLKKLLLDSMTGSYSSSTANFNFADNGNSTHEQKESVDNLNDEIEVWRSKFLSSCVLVEQLTRDNQMLNDSINSACEILQDLKNTLPLSPAQYNVVSEWLRKNRFTSNSFGTCSRQSIDAFSNEHNQD